MHKQGVWDSQMHVSVHQISGVLIYNGVPVYYSCIIMHPLTNTFLYLHMKSMFLLELWVLLEGGGWSSLRDCRADSTSST